MTDVITLGELVHGATGSGFCCTVVVRRAARARRCDATAAPDCLKRVPAGCLYSYSTVWPGHDVNDGPRPWNMAKCEPCTRWYAANGQNPHLAPLFAPPPTWHGLSDPTGVTDCCRRAPADLPGDRFRVVGAAGYVTCAGVAG